MERRDDIRAAMQSLLSSARRPDNRSNAEGGERRRSGQLSVRIRPHHDTMLMQIQEELRQHGISTDEAEILQALCDAMAHRPDIYKGLMATYLLTP